LLPHAAQAKEGTDDNERLPLDHRVCGRVLPLQPPLNLYLYSLSHSPGMVEAVIFLLLILYVIRRSIHTVVLRKVGSFVT